MREGRIISNYDAEFPYLNFVYHIVCIVGKERQELEKERTKKNSTTLRVLKSSLNIFTRLHLLKLQKRNKQYSKLA